jgi:hypothetical protein
MSRTTTLLLYMMTGAFVGVVAASVIIPPFLSWYNEQGAINAGKQVETLCNIPELIRYTSTRLLRGQAIGAVVGAVVFLIPGLLRSRRHPSTGLPTTSAGASAPRPF